ncbi:hypothetical protein BGX34_011278 [Mortierella sp. NVP85]|nr:hypothetical protein BGX34_011278 [Mortierella sp. NVP85]
MAIIADPQLTDWFSYGQSGLLLMLVETYTDLYMRRSFRRLHKSLQPDAVLFLGDLNDGGRGSNKDVFDKNTGRFFERIFDTRSSAWNQAPIVQDVEESAVTTDAPYAVNITGRYQQRMDVPLDSLTREWIRTQGKSVRLYVAGNHDVGFGNTLIRPSMVRYKQTFGSVNYEVKVGNHSLVVLDTLALSADTPEIREESQQFLTQLGEETPTLPRILFTHVPLFRLDTTYCGDARETKQLILNRGGEQYWNMVNSSLSQETLHAIRPDMVFSGDDHDWCEIAHPLDGSFTPEVTLPTFSFAQGIQQPGFVMLSLYNPDRKVRNQFPVISTSSPSGLPVSTTHESSGTVARPSTDATFAYEACMLPNQLQIYKVYGLLFGCTLSLILIRRYRWIMRGRRYLEGGPLLEGWKDTSYTDTEPLGSTTATAPQYQQLRQQDWFGDEYVGESPPSPVLTSLDNSYRDGQRNKWSFYWKVVAWDMWHIARFAVPLYLLLFAFTML